MYRPWNAIDQSQQFRSGLKARLSAKEIEERWRCKVCKARGCRVEAYEDLSIDGDIYHRFKVVCPEGHVFTVDSSDLIKPLENILLGLTVLMIFFAVPFALLGEKIVSTLKAPFRKKKKN